MKDLVHLVKYDTNYHIRSENPDSYTNYFLKYSVCIIFSACLLK